NLHFAGQSAAWVVEAADVTLEQYGCFVGSHAVVVLSDKDDMKAVAPNLMRFFEDESCGQCTPCRAGTEKAVKPMATGPGDKTLLTELSDALRRLDLRAGPGCAQPAAERVQVFPGGAGEAARELVMKMLPHIKCRSRKGGNPYSRNLRVWHD